MGKVVNIRYFTKEKNALASEDNRKTYDKYLKSNIINYCNFK